MNIYIFMDNKLKIIDYLIILKLIMKNKNMDMPVLFYKLWLEYLQPYINKNYFNKINSHEYISILNLNSAITNYNLKDYLLFKFNSEFKKQNNFNFEIKINYNIIGINKYIFFEINLYNHNNIFFSKIEKFIYQYPEIDIHFIINTKFNYNNFNNYMLKIWELEHGVIMYDYFISNPLKKIIYYDFFNKIIKKNIIIFYSY